MNRWENEEDGIPELVERLTAVTAVYKDRAEIILIDDGSTDGTLAAIERAREKHPQLRGIRMSSNRGHQIALTAGLQAATGGRIFMLDADLQDPPELLADMMIMMDRGYDVVYGRRGERQSETIFKKATAHLFYRALNLMSDVPIPKDTGDFRLVSRRALDAVLAMPEKARFIRGMFAWVGYDQIGIEYTRAARTTGETKYPLRKMLRLSFVSFGVAGLMMLYVARSLILYQTVPGWASVVVAISAFSGVQLLTLGILGEYVGRLYVEAKNRPLYFVSEDTRTEEPVKLKARA